MRIEQGAAAYRRLLGASTADDGAADPYLAGELLAYAYPERVAQRLSEHGGQYRLANGQMATLAETDDLSAEPWIAVAEVDGRADGGRIFSAMPLHEASLEPLTRERSVVGWDAREARVVARREWRIGNLLWRQRALTDVDAEAIAEALCGAVERSGEQLLAFDGDDVAQWQARVMSLRAWHREAGWPDVSTPALLASVREWLWPYLNGITKGDELRRLPLRQILQSALTYEQQLELDRLAPERITVPSGSHIKLTYFADGAQPVLAVRLQELFGLAETPTVDDGRRPLLLHLLSPGFKPVQIASDLRSFWDGAYHEVRRELRRRYPKHVWPDDPWTEQAIRGTKRRP